MPNSPHKIPTLLAGFLGHVRYHGNVHSITQALAKDLQASLTHGIICVPPHPLGAPRVYYLENMGPSPCPSYSEEFIPHYGTPGHYKAFRGPYDIYILLFGPL